MPKDRNAMGDRSKFLNEDTRFIETLALFASLAAEEIRNSTRIARMYLADLTNVVRHP